jgi:hypothetical protein
MGFEKEKEEIEMAGGYEIRARNVSTIPGFHIIEANIAHRCHLRTMSGTEMLRQKVDVT